MAQAQRPDGTTGQRPRPDASVDAALQRAVDHIAAHCRGQARALLRAGHPFLTRKVILQLSRTTAERQRYELNQVLQGQRPFRTKSTVFDTTGYAEIVSRLARAGGYTNKAVQVLRCLLARMRRSQ